MPVAAHIESIGRWLLLAGTGIGLLASCAQIDMTREVGAGVPVLMYHEIFTGDKEPGETAISLQRFTEQMQYLADNHYTPVSTASLADYMKSGTPLPPRAIVLTFDDGWKNVLNAVPILKKHHFKASFWVITGTGIGIGGDYMDWSNIEALSRDPNFEVQSHSVTHPWDRASNLVTWAEGKVAGRGLNDVRRELIDSKRTLESHVRQPVRFFAWPCGWYNDAMVKLASEVGYEALMTAESGLNHQGDSVLHIKRTFVDGACDMADFIDTVKTGRYKVCQKRQPSTTGLTP